MSYDYEFASVYDYFTENVDYKKRADYITDQLKKNGIDSGILLDVACGTGSFIEYYRDSGYDVIGVDISYDMLSIAREKFSECKDVLLLCQDMRELDLYGTIDCAVCSLDSMNHLLTEDDLLKALKRVSLFMRKDGIFIFDINSVYKHRKILSDKSFVYENEDAFLVWQNSPCDENDKIEIMLDIFVADEDDKYMRYCEDFSERAYSIEKINELIDNADFDIIGIFGDMTEETPKDNEERIYYIVRKR